MKNNINTKEYWEKRFNEKGDWDKNGRRQTYEYAKANLSRIDIPKNFTGSILDFGCALGDAIPVYRGEFPLSKLYGMDISQNAIDECNKVYGDLAICNSGDATNVEPVDIIIVSHVMEHLTNDRAIVKNLLKNCDVLYIFALYKENPLYREHVNYYNYDYYLDFNVISKKYLVLNILLN